MAKARYRWLVWILICIALVSGCSAPVDTPTPQPTEVPTVPIVQPPTATPLPLPSPSATQVLPAVTPTVRIVHLATPGEPGESLESQILDVDSSAYANSKRAAGGDNFDNGEFERPFNAGSMDRYSADLDIVQAGLRRSGDWITVTIHLSGTPKGTLLSGSYGVEIDIDADGRGDFLVVARKPGLIWSVNDVSIWRDANHDVGGRIAIKADGTNTGDGFELQLFDSGKGYDTDAAWARVNPNDFRSVQISFKKAVIDNDKAFLWNAWAAEKIQPSLFDYNDHFTLAEAGSPIPAQDKAYPLNQLANVDNTCRWAVGFTPTGAEPGLCPLTIDPYAGNSESYIHGLVWYDRNGNLYQDPGEPGFENMELILAEGACGTGGKIQVSVITAINGTYEIRGMKGGNYCIHVVGPLPPGVSPVKGTGQLTILLKTGGEVKANFPFALSNP